MYFETTNSALGPLTLFAEADKIIALEFGSVAKDRPTPILREAILQLKAYFIGQLTYFNLPIKTSGTNFQQDVWGLILKIPYGTTLSYGELAQNLNSAPRSIGGACGKNPIPIIVPCHRVLAANYKIGGFSGGYGISTKTSLLRLEGINIKFNKK